MEGATNATMESFLKSLDPKGDISKFFTLDTLWLVMRLIVILVVGILIVRILVAIAKRVTRKNLSSRTAEMVVKAIRYTGYLIVIVNVANVAGIDLSALLGAAGIAGIAIGFAAQTSVSNLISGIFLLTEKAYAVGDVLDVGGGIVGIVDSIDMLSVKLRTFDNRLVRIPNETLVKSNIINITRYPIRRLDIKVSITYQDNIEKAHQILEEIARANPWVLRNPAPIFIVDGFGASGVDLFFGVWFSKDDFLNAKNTILAEIKHRFDSEGVEFAYQTLTVYQKRPS